jgi:6-pyruvoyltetrahydropterin/6-carboxytetrahydropterin synthase
MLRLTREVRFALNLASQSDIPPKVRNAYAGHPPILGDAVYLRLEVTVTGELDPSSQYLLNIKDIDDTVRTDVIPLFASSVGRQTLTDLTRTVLAAHDRLSQRIPSLPGAAGRGVQVLATLLHLSPYQSIGVNRLELPMVRLSSMFEFSAAHRLHNPAQSYEQNVATFGKCNNPLGHGHNYQVQVTLRCDPSSVVPTADFERTVDEHLIKPLDHKHLNLEVHEFRDRSDGGGGVIPSVENIAKVAFHRLRGPLGSSLASVTVWETPKTFAEYSE